MKLTATRYGVKALFILFFCAVQHGLLEAKAIKKSKHAVHKSGSKKYNAPKGEFCVNHSYCSKYSDLDCASEWVQLNCPRMCRLCEYEGPELMKLPAVLYYKKGDKKHGISGSKHKNKHSAKHIDKRDDGDRRDVVFLRHPNDYSPTKQPDVVPTTSYKLFDYQSNYRKWLFLYPDEHPVHMQYVDEGKAADPYQQNTAQQTAPGAQDAAPAGQAAAPASAVAILMTNLKETCISFMKAMLNPSNCLGIEAAAFKFNCTALRSTASQYVYDNFVAVSQTDEFKLLSADRLAEYLGSDDIRVEREEQVFECLMQWINHDIEVRRGFFKILSQHVRFPLMSPYYLADHVETEEIVLSSPECTSLILEAKNYHMLPDRRHLIKGSRTKPRRSMGVISVIFAAGGIQGSTVMRDTFGFFPAANRWSPLAHMIIARCRHGLAVTGDMVYAVGGQSREGAAQSSLNSVERYDPRTNTWTMVAPMNMRRSLLNVAVLDGNMYAVGGCDESNFRLNSVERYHPATNTWSFTAPMTTCRSSPCVLTCRVLYVIGGVSYVGMSLNTGEYLDPMTNTWRAIAPMHYKRASASGAATNGKIYIIGGWDGSVHLNSGEVYDPDIDQWSLIEPASTARWDAGIAVESDKIFIVGGCDRNALCTLETECYDPEKDKWSKVASLPVATHGIKCCTIQLPHKFA